MGTEKGEWLGRGLLRGATKISNELERGSPCHTLPKCQARKEKNQGRSRGLVACEAGWRSSGAGDRVGPSAGGVYPTQGPYGPGLRASVAAAVRHRHRVPAARATARCSAVPGAPACTPPLCRRAAHHQCRRGCPGPPRCQGDSCGISGPRSSRWCPPRGGDRRDTGVPPPTFLEGEKGPRPVAVSVKTDVLTPWLPTAASHSHTATKTFPARKATSESFPCPPQSLFPAKTGFAANSRKSALQKCILPRPPSPPPGLGSVPKVGAPLRGFLPHPRVRRPGTRRSQLTMVTPAAVAPPPGPAA